MGFKNFGFRVTWLSGCPHQQSPNKEWTDRSARVLSRNGS